MNFSALGGGSPAKPRRQAQAYWSVSLSPEGFEVSCSNRHEGVETCGRLETFTTTEIFRVAKCPTKADVIAYLQENLPDQLPKPVEAAESAP